MESADYKGKNVLVLGLGRFGGGVGVTRFLAKSGAHVRVSDAASAAELQSSINQLKDYTIDYRLGSNQESDLDNIDLVVVNPVFAPTHPFIKIIEKRGIEQTTEVNIFFQLCQGKIIAVIGTNGKETVVKLIEAMLKNANKEVVVGGNIGASLLSQLDEIGTQTWVVFELSSFQLHRLRSILRRPEIAVYCNIQPDHLQWHGNLDNYINDKCVALVGQGKEGVAVINVDDPILRRVSEQVEGNLIPTSLSFIERGVYVQNNQIIANLSGKKVTLSPTELKIPGRHNLSNAVLAAAVAYSCGANPQSIQSALAHFNGVAHALEFVAEIKGVKYYNDSAATNPTATIAALESFDQPIWLIVGGFDKQIDYTPVAKIISQKTKGVATIGQLTQSLASLIESFSGTTQIERAGNLSHALAWANQRAQAGGCVVLSPSTSSYDQYNNLEERGEEFVRLVKKLVNQKAGS